MRDSPTRRVLPSAEEWPHTERAEHLSQYRITQRSHLSLKLCQQQWHPDWEIKLYLLINALNGWWQLEQSVFRYNSRITMQNQHYDKDQGPMGNTQATTITIMLLKFN